MVKIDLIIVGNSGAGKTCYVKRYIANPNEEFSMIQEPAIGMDLFSKTIVVNGKQIKINIWDTAGQDKYFSLTRGLFQKADGVLLAFDLTDQQSFKKVQDYWIQQVIENSDSTVKKVLLGNKLDMIEDRKVETLAAAELAQKYKMTYFETSAKTGESVALSIETLAKQCAFSIEEQRLDANEDMQFQLNPNQPKKQNCFDKMKDITGKLYSMVTFGSQKKKNNATFTAVEKQEKQVDDAQKQQQLSEFSKENQKSSISDTPTIDMNAKNL